MVKIDNESAFHAAIKDLRDGHEINWLLASHVENNPDQIHLVGSGSGGINELASKLSDNSVSYGLVRVSQKIDLSTTVKFVYIYFIGESVPALQKGKIGSTHGAIKQLLTPYHIDFEITSTNEISEEILHNKLSDNSGNSDKVREVSNDGTQAKTYKKPASSVPQASAGSGGTVAASSEVSQAVNDVRNDKTETNWVLLAYTDNDLKKALHVVSTGNGGVDELVSHLSADLIAYGFIRVVDVIEGIKTVKFAFITYIGADVSIMKKAKVSTNKGSVAALFAPYHVTLEVTSTNELSDEILLTTVQEASGSKSKVK